MVITGSPARPAARGTGEAWVSFSVEQAYAEHAGVLYGWAVGALGDRAEAEDLVQEVFTRAWRAAEHYDAVRGSERTWLFAIARNLVLDAHRARGRRPLTAQEATEAQGPVAPGPEEAVVERMRVVEALATLSPEHREVVSAVHLDGRTYADLAERTGVGVATLRTRMYYGLRALRAALDQGRGGGDG